MLAPSFSLAAEVLACATRCSKVVAVAIDRAVAQQMSHSTLGVGIIGVSPVWGWAATAHIPALRALPNYEIRAVSAHSAEAARAVDEKFGISWVFSDHEELVARPDIDLVAVTVKAPHHRELVSAALAAGKAVYCEWPLGRDLDDARFIAALAAQTGVRTVVGLQARQAPAVEFVRQLLDDGYVGEVLSATMIGTSVPGGTVVRPNAYMLDRANGANVLTIAIGHSMDTLCHVLGEFAELSALSALRRPLITIEGTGEQMTKTSPDQVAVIGTLTSGATASIHVRESVAGGIGFLWEINGTDGTLRITADAAYPEIFPLTVTGARGQGEPTNLEVPAALTGKWPALASLEGAPAYNVGRAYAAFAEDIDSATHTVPDFAHAVRRHEVIAAIERSAALGERVTV
jgi:predicted dehydrogenase